MTLVYLRQHLPLSTLSTYGHDMAPTKGSASYKKKDGTLALSKDKQSISWTPVVPPGSPPFLVLQVSQITSKDVFVPSTINLLICPQTSSSYRPPAQR